MHDAAAVFSVWQDSFYREGFNVAKTAQEKYFDHPPLQVLAMSPSLEFKEGNRDRSASYNVRYQTPFGEVGGRVDPVIYQDAERLKDEAVVCLEVRPRSEHPKGQFIKGGFYYQFDIVGILPVPADFAERPTPRTTGAAKQAASSF